MSGCSSAFVAYTNLTEREPLGDHHRSGRLAPDAFGRDAHAASIPNGYYNERAGVNLDCFGCHRY
jgi:hypothetical protein